MRGWLARTCLDGQACGTCLRRIMLPTQSGELLSSHQCSDARTPGGSTVFGIPLLTFCGLMGYLLGYLLALVNSLWIILSIWRSGRL